ncbi:MAG TPA: ATP-binding protein [bacterium]|nr:ATP-binding protein [bacterium]
MLITPQEQKVKKMIANRKMVIRLDPKLAVVEINGSLDSLKITGEKSFVKKSLNEKFNLFRNDDLDKICLAAIEHGKTSEIEISLPNDDIIYWYSLVAEPEIAERTITGARLIVSDITLKKRQERHKVLHEKMLSIALLAAQVAHKLNNPLAAVLNRVGSVLVNEIESGNITRIKNELELIQEQIYSMSVITNALVSFSKESESTYYLLDINDIVEKSIELSKLLQIQSNIQYKVHLEPNLPVIRGSEVTLEQCIINIIRNALEAMPNSGVFTVSTGYDKLSDDYISIIFHDTGIGIPEEQLEFVFDPFYKTKDESHSGLGLSISYGIIANHKGSIDIISKPGKGTTVVILLPIAH